MSILIDVWNHIRRFTSHAHSKEEILEAMAANYAKDNGVDLDWKNSVVDRMKLLKIDEASTDFKSRKRIAAYYGIPDYRGTAEQNAKLMDAITDDLIR